MTKVIFAAPMPKRTGAQISMREGYQEWEEQDSWSFSWEEILDINKLADEVQHCQLLVFYVHARLEAYFSSLAYEPYREFIYDNAFELVQKDKLQLWFVLAPTMELGAIDDFKGQLLPIPEMVRFVEFEDLQTSLRVVS